MKMKSSKIFLCMTVLVCLAVSAFAQDPLGLGSRGNSMGSGGDWISPNMGSSYPTNWMEGGYVTSHDRSMTDPGIASMLHWLDAPISSSDLAFYYPGPLGVYPYNPSPYYSDFRLSSLAGMQKGYFQKNWTETMNYVKASSSMKVYQNGLWVTP
jgi:hypothetical protein